MSKSRPPFATTAEVQRLRALDERWKKWSSLLEQYTITNLTQSREQARNNFLANPTDESAKALMEYADPRLMASRYRAVASACNEALEKLAYELRDIMVPLLERKLVVLEKSLASALKEEAVQKEKVMKKGSLFERKVNGAVQRAQHAISRTKDAIAELNELPTQRTPASWLEFYG